MEETYQASFSIYSKPLKPQEKARQGKSCPESRRLNETPINLPTKDFSFSRAYRKQQKQDRIFIETGRPAFHPPQTLLGRPALNKNTNKRPSYTSQLEPASIRPQHERKNKTPQIHKRCMKRRSTIKIRILFLLYHTSTRYHTSTT